MTFFVGGGKRQGIKNNMYHVNLQTDSQVVSFIFQKQHFRKDQLR
jgi:hypothetical protein